MTGISWAQAEEYWVQAGGSPQSAAMAAAISDASSGLNPDATNTASDGTISRGLWQIPSTLNALSTTDPLANARAAVQVSNNGTDFSSWCSAWSDNACGNNGGTYLGDGSNAVAALIGQGKTYAPIGGQGVSTNVTTPDTGSDTGTGNSDNGVTADQTSTAANAPTTASGGSSKIVIFIVLGLILAVVIYLKMRSGKKAEPSKPPAE